MEIDVLEYISNSCFQIIGLKQGLRKNVGQTLHEAMETEGTLA